MVEDGPHRCDGSDQGEQVSDVMFINTPANFRRYVCPRGHEQSSCSFLTADDGASSGPLCNICCIEWLKANCPTTQVEESK